MMGAPSADAARIDGLYELAFRRHQAGQLQEAEGLYRSEIFPDLWLDPAALLRGDLATVLAVVQRGLASPEHTAFAARLRPPSPTA